jgi:hypothetical protein
MRLYVPFTRIIDDDLIYCVRMSTDRKYEDIRTRN